jgi:hypothetical protein
MIILSNVNIIMNNNRQTEPKTVLILNFDKTMDFTISNITIFRAVTKIFKRSMRRVVEFNFLNSRSNRNFQEFYFNYREQNGRLYELDRGLANRPIRLINNNQIDRLVRNTVEVGAHHSVLNSNPDAVSRSILQLPSWTPARSNTPFFNYVNSEANANGQLFRFRNEISRQIGYSEESEVFRNFENFLVQRMVNSSSNIDSGNFLRYYQTVSPETIRNYRFLSHYLSSNIFHIGSGNNNDVTVISFNTFTHASQQFLNDNRIGLDSIPGLRLHRISDSDFTGSLRAQHILTNSVVVPRNRVNLIEIDNHQQIGVPRMRDIRNQLLLRLRNEEYVGLQLGRPYYFLENTEQYNTLREALTPSSNNNLLQNSNRALALIEEEATAFEFNELSPALERQLTVMLLIEKAQSEFDLNLTLNLLNEFNSQQ